MNWIRRLVAFVPAALLAVAYAAGVHLLDLDPLRHVPASAKGVGYQTLAGVSGALLGFGLTASTVFYAVAPQSRLALVIGRGGDVLRRFLTTTFVALAVSTIGFAVAIPIDRTDKAHWMRYVAVGLLGVTITATVQLVWFADRIFGLLSIQIAEQESTSEWMPPDVGESYNVPRRQQLS